MSLAQLGPEQYHGQAADEVIAIAAVVALDMETGAGAGGQDVRA